MGTEEAEVLANAHMKRWLGPEWKFRFNGRRSSAGLCVWTAAGGFIELSKHYVAVNERPAVLDTVLHEIAHALAGRVGHGPGWVAACRLVGAVPDRHCQGVAPRGKYSATCPGCLKSYQKQRRPKGLHHCPDCGPKTGLLLFSPSWSYTQGNS